MKEFLIKRWFLLALFTSLVIGISFARKLELLTEISVVRNLIVASVLFLMALPLEFHAIWRAMTRPMPPLLAVGVNFGLLPLFAWLVSFGLRDEMAIGLLVAAATPCTLASASVWTRRAGGNDAVAILVTLTTNTTCVVITPLWLVWMTGERVDSPELSFSRMTMRLGLLVVLPMVLAQLARMLPGLGEWTTARKSLLSSAAQCGILMMVFLGAIRTGISIGDQEVSLWRDLPGMLAAVLLVHLTMFAAGVRLARWFGMPREDEIAVGFAGSQKTLPVGLLLAVSLEVTILPMVTYHVCQLLVDTFIADRYRNAQNSLSCTEDG